MPKVNLSGMTIEALMDLRERVDGMLVERRAAIEQQLERMDKVIALAGGARAGGSGLKGTKVPPLKLGQAVAQDLVGLLLRSRVERRSMIS
jgi:hypothetical protein